MTRWGCAVDCGGSGLFWSQTRHSADPGFDVVIATGCCIGLYWIVYEKKEAIVRTKTTEKKALQSSQAARASGLLNNTTVASMFFEQHHNSSMRRALQNSLSAGPKRIQDPRVIEADQRLATDFKKSKYPCLCATKERQRISHTHRPFLSLR
jgi:hypothetical protein